MPGSSNESSIATEQREWVKVDTDPKVATMTEEELRVKRVEQAFGIAKRLMETSSSQE